MTHLFELLLAVELRLRLLPLALLFLQLALHIPTLLLQLTLPDFEQTDFLLELFQVLVDLFFPLLFLLPDAFDCLLLLFELLQLDLLLLHHSHELHDLSTHLLVQTAFEVLSLGKLLARCHLV